MYLNDTTEFSYTMDIYSSVLRTAVKDREAVFPITHTKILQLSTDNAEWIDKASVFTACFSRARDDLSQWRAYAGRTPGFSIGFDPIALGTLGDRVKFSLRDCVYDPAQLTDQIEDLIHSCVSGLERIERGLRMLAEVPNPDFFGWPIWTPMVTRVIELAEISKHPSFAAEREVRMVGFKTSEGHELISEIRYRQAGSLVVPYVGIKLAPDGDALPIKAILVGPCPHQAAVVRAVEGLAKQHGLQADVRSSSVPFRNW
jgi:hypothetical protein